MVSGTITHQNSQPSIQTMVPDTFLFPGCLKRPSSKAAANYHLIRGGWDDPNCAHRSHPPTHWQIFSPALPSDYFAIDFPGRAISPG
jgi:hypothetical protein